jgi:glycosyltransferase involved in cell wall biosynthesis
MVGGEQSRGDDNPGIAVVIRSHNYGRFLTEAMVSVMGQTRPPDEIVVVDDGSTDETGEVMDRLRADGAAFKTIRRTSPHGPASSFNDGVLATTGGLLLTLDADDRLSRRYLELAENALACSGADIAYGGEHRFGVIESESPAPPWDPDGLLVENWLHVSALFRRWIFDAADGFDPAFDRLGLEDWEYWVSAIEAGARGVPVDGCWLEYRRHEVGSRNTFSRARSLRGHLLVHRLHPETVRLRHLSRWAGRSMSRNFRRVTRTMRANA